MVKRGAIADLPPTVVTSLCAAHLRAAANGRMRRIQNEGHAASYLTVPQANIVNLVFARDVNPLNLLAPRTPSVRMALLAYKECAPKLVKKPFGVGRTRSVFHLQPVGTYVSKVII